MELPEYVIIQRGEVGLNRYRIKFINNCDIFSSDRSRMETC